MSTHHASGHSAALEPPVLFIVDADERARDTAASALVRRFGADYRVVSAGTPQEGLDALQGLADQRDAVALVAADLRRPGMDAVEFLQRAHVLHPRCIRVLLAAMDRYHTRIPLTELGTLARATALGRIDFAVVKGWVTPEEWLYPQVREALTAWRIANRPTHVVYRIVGQRWDRRSHDLLRHADPQQRPVRVLRRRLRDRTAADRRAGHRRAPTSRRDPPRRLGAA